MPATTAASGGDAVLGVEDEEFGEEVVDGVEAVGGKDN